MRIFDKIIIRLKETTKRHIILLSILGSEISSLVVCSFNNSLLRLSSVCRMAAVISALVKRPFLGYFLSKALKCWHSFSDVDVVPFVFH